MNIWLGSNELVLVSRDGTHYVVEKYEDYNPVFQGHYEECVDYMKAREVDYLESLY